MVRSNTEKRTSKERPDCQDKSVPAWTQGVNTFQIMWLERGRTQPDDKNIYGLVPENVRSPASNLTLYDICHSSFTYIHALQVRLRKPHIHTCTKTHRHRHVASESTSKQYFFNGMLEILYFCLRFSNITIAYQEISVIEVHPVYKEEWPAKCRSRWLTKNICLWKCSGLQSIRIACLEYSYLVVQFGAKCVESSSSTASVFAARAIQNCHNRNCILNSRCQWQNVPTATGGDRQGAN